MTCIDSVIYLIVISSILGVSVNLERPLQSICFFPLLNTYTFPATGLVMRGVESSVPLSTAVVTSERGFSPSKDNVFKDSIAIDL